MHCLGIGKLDWIEQVIGKKIISSDLGSSFFIMNWINSKLPKDNWVYFDHGTRYFIHRKFFDDEEHKGIEAKMKYFIIDMNF